MHGKYGVPKKYGTFCIARAQLEIQIIFPLVAQFYETVRLAYILPCTYFNTDQTKIHHSVISFFNDKYAL